MPTQQDALYAAEAGLPAGRQFDSIPELQQFVDELRDTAWWQRDYDMVLRVDVGKADQKLTRGSVGRWDPERNAGVIEMAPVHMDMLSVAHELSHVLAAAKWGSRSHDPAFARTYGILTYHLLGSDAWVALKAEFDRHGIDYA